MYWQRILLWLIGVAFLVPLPAWSLSCAFREASGFLHAQAALLPANTKGVLFADAGQDFSKPDWPIRPRFAADFFKITSPTDQRDLKPVLTRLTMYRDDKPSREIVRVGVQGGFLPGASYSVSTLAERPNWEYPVKHDFTMSEQALDTSGAAQVKLLGPSLRTFHLRPYGSGTVAVQGFTVQFPPSYQPFLTATMVLSERQSNGGEFVSNDHSPSDNCAMGGFGQTAASHRDEVKLPCETAPGRVNLRAWVGMLEVSDKLELTDVVSADLASSAASSCAPFALLNSALKRADTAGLRRTVCDIGSAPGNILRHLEAQNTMRPSVAGFRKLAQHEDRQVRACSVNALARMVADTRAPPAEATKYFITLARTHLASQDAAMIASTLDALDHLLKAQDDQGKPKGSMLAGVLPELRGLALRNGPGAAQALGMMADIAPDKAIADLKAVATSGQAHGPAALARLERVLPAAQYERLLLSEIVPQWLGADRALSAAAFDAIERYQKDSIGSMYALHEQAKVALAAAIPQLITLLDQDYRAVLLLGELGPHAATAVPAIVASADAGYAKAAGREGKDRKLLVEYFETSHIAVLRQILSPADYHALLQSKPNWRLAKSPE